MKKVIGYAISIIGIGFMAIGFEMIPLGLEVLNGVAKNYIAWAGAFLVALGVVLSLMDKSSKGSSSKSGEDEVPIYEGVGKKRRVVGYRRK